MSIKLKARLGYVMVATAIFDIQSLKYAYVDIFLLKLYRVLVDFMFSKSTCKCF